MVALGIKLITVCKALRTIFSTEWTLIDVCCVYCYQSLLLPLMTEGYFRVKSPREGTVQQTGLRLPFEYVVGWRVIWFWHIQLKSCPSPSLQNPDLTIFLEEIFTLKTGQDLPTPLKNFKGQTQLSNAEGFRWSILIYFTKIFFHFGHVV